ncbi:MAG TPA: hypothetical protein EYP49_15320 [Anaerolineae bacterium]|nr:hypothetical protein [Anaerolineae bacterium]
MPPRVPEAVRQAWGDELVTEIVPWLEQIVQEKALPRDEYRQVLSRLEVLEHDVADVKADLRELRGEMGGLRGEMGGLRGEMGGLRGEMNERFDRMNERFDRMNERFTEMERHFEARFDQMNERFVEIERHFETRLDQMSERMLVQTRWLIGTIALFGTILTILMAIAQFAP